MFKKMMLVTALGVAVLSSSWVFAADDARSSIHITANIPNKQFHVQPRNPDFGKDEYMYYNPVSNLLSPLRETFDVKNTDGSVHAYLYEAGSSSGRVALYNGEHYIPLFVKFNGIELNNFPQEVVDDASSTPGTQADMHISAHDLIYRLKPGLYTGSFTVIFDAVPRVTL
ncbi:CS1 type fimbrial major subunit [Pseudomonas sp. OA65]|uniref:CS1 type fimbrial major subunit n=1 Tax=Pseudomonas sp. OA65 TaxID=2818431 RepID=UPI001A9D407F|nr:CS1 type fimbrial major subunit [Pseudomonas sp. OA65]MBO1541373.1 adhesin [Pseudomonas sp. OA65]